MPEGSVFGYRALRKGGRCNPPSTGAFESSGATLVVGLLIGVDDVSQRGTSRLAALIATSVIRGSLAELDG